MGNELSFISKSNKFPYYCEFAYLGKAFSIEKWFEDREYLNHFILTNDDVNYIIIELTLETLEEFKKDAQAGKFGNFHEIDFVKCASLSIKALNNGNRIFYIIDCPYDIGACENEPILSK